MRLLLVGKASVIQNSPLLAGQTDFDLLAVPNEDGAFSAMRAAARPHLILIDFAAPLKGVIDFCRRLREIQLSPPPYIVVFGVPSRSLDIVSLLDAGVNDCWEKSLDHPETVARLKSAAQFVRGIFKLPQLRAPTVIPAVAPKRPASAAQKSFAEFRKMIETLPAIQRTPALIAQALERRGVAPVIYLAAPPARNCIPPEFSLLQCVILPQREIWFDLLLELDRPSAVSLFQLLAGGKNPNASDLFDVIGETLNMIQTAFHATFRNENLDVITPVVPQSVSTQKLNALILYKTVRREFCFEVKDIRIKLSILAHPAPLLKKRLREISLADVLAESIRPDQDSDLILLHKGTLLNERYLKKVHDFAEIAPPTARHPVIDPSPLTALLNMHSI